MENIHQAVTVIPSFIKIKAPIRCAISQVHKLARLIGVVHLKNEVAILSGGIVIGDQAMIDRSETGDINAPDSVMVELVSQPLCDTLLPRTRHRKNNPPITQSPVSRPPKTEILLQHDGLAERKTVQILVAWNHHFSPRAGAPRGNPAYCSDDLLVVRLRNPREIRTKFRELKKLENSPAHLEAVPRKIGWRSVSSADLRLVVRYRLVVEVGLIRKAERVRLEIKRFAPGRRAPDSQHACEHK